jgi:NAD(P)H-dependent FMN reductase
MKITLICASSRANSQSLKITKYLEQSLSADNVDTEIIDLNILKLPVYDDSGEGDWKTAWDDVSKTLDKSDGFVVVSPEWNGMAGPAWFNMLHYTDHEMAHKPLMLVGVSSGLGGVYPLADMRLLGSKNVHFTITPESLRIANVEKIFNDREMDEGASDYSVKKRAEN